MRAPRRSGKTTPWRRSAHADPSSTRTSPTWSHPVSHSSRRPPRAARPRARNPGSQSASGYIRGSGTSMSAAVVSGAWPRRPVRPTDLEPRWSEGPARRALPTMLSTRAGAGAGALDLGAALAAAPDGACQCEPRGSNPRRRTRASGDRVRTTPRLWADFAAAWKAGDLDAVKAAWDDAELADAAVGSPRMVLAVLAGSLGDRSRRTSPPAPGAARSWSLRLVAGPILERPHPGAARSWSYEEWLARSWSARILEQHGPGAARIAGAPTSGSHDPGRHDPGRHDPGRHAPGAARSWAARSWSCTGSWSDYDPGQHDPGATARGDTGSWSMAT